MIDRVHCWHVVPLCRLLMFSVSCGSYLSSCHDCPPLPPGNNSGSWSESVGLPGVVQWRGQSDDEPTLRNGY